MAHAMLTDEDLQQSAAQSDDDLNYAGSGQSQTRSQLNPGVSVTNQAVESSNGSRHGDEENLHMHDADQEDDDMNRPEDEGDADQGESDEEEENDEDSEEEERSHPEDDEDESRDGGDFDMIDDNDQGNGVNRSAHGIEAVPMSMSEEGGQDEDEDEDEGVGAVKIRPGDMDDDDEEAESEGSSSQSEGEEESDAEEVWEETGENEDEDSDNEVPSSNCVFCKEDEEHDPSEEFEAYLACTGCSDNAHQQCARDAGAMAPDNGMLLPHTDTAVYNTGIML